MPGSGEELVATSYRRVSVWRGVSFCDIITALSHSHTFPSGLPSHFSPENNPKGYFCGVFFLFPIVFGKFWVPVWSEEGRASVAESAVRINRASYTSCPLPFLLPGHRFLFSLSPHAFVRGIRRHYFAEYVGALHLSASCLPLS